MLCWCWLANDFSRCSWCIMELDCICLCTTRCRPACCNCLLNHCIWRHSLLLCHLYQCTTKFLQCDASLPLCLHFRKYQIHISRCQLPIQQPTILCKLCEPCPIHH